VLLDSIGFGTIREVYFPETHILWEGGFEVILSAPLAIFYPADARQLATVAKVTQYLCTLVTDESGVPDGKWMIDYGLHIVTIDEEASEVRLILRNWQLEMTRAFKGVIDSLAPLYRWKVAHGEILFLNTPQQVTC
jgi:hypothetical protein